MRHNHFSPEQIEYYWLVTGTVWDRDLHLYASVRRATFSMYWLSPMSRPGTAAMRLAVALEYLDTGLIAATGASTHTLWISRARPHRTKPVPHTLTGVREVTAEGARILLLLTGADQTVPIGICEQQLLAPDTETPCASGDHRHCPGGDQHRDPCRCRCGCRWPDRLTIWRNLAHGDQATDPAWQWPFLVTADPETDDVGNLAVQVRGDDEQITELIHRRPNEPVLIHNAWRPDRTSPGQLAPGSPS